MKRAALSVRTSIFGAEYKRAPGGFSLRRALAERGERSVVDCPGTHGARWGAGQLVGQPLRASRQQVEDPPAVVKVDKDEYQRVHHEVCGEQNVEYDAVVVRQPAHEVVYGVREAEHQVANEHRQHGPSRLVHDGSRAWLLQTDGQLAFVPLHLKR